MTKNPVEYVYSTTGYPIMSRELTDEIPARPNGPVKIHLTPTEWELWKNEYPKHRTETFHEIKEQWKLAEGCPGVYYSDAINLNHTANDLEKRGMISEANSFRNRAKRAVKDSLTVHVNDNYEAVKMAKHMLATRGSKEKALEKIQEWYEEYLNSEDISNTKKHQEFWLEVRNIINDMSEVEAFQHTLGKPHWMNQDL